jgi:hypothetical protein
VFERTQQLTHPALRQVEPLGGPAEVQFLGQDKEALQLAELQADDDLRDR